MFLTAMLDCAISQMPLAPAATAEQTNAAMTVVFPIYQSINACYTSNGQTDSHTCPRRSLYYRQASLIRTHEHVLNGDLLRVVEGARRDDARDVSDVSDGKCVRPCERLGGRLHDIL